MTLKTSLFNKGIYKSTVRRYVLGSVLYFILLFMMTVLPIVLLTDLEEITVSSVERTSILFGESLLVPSVILAMVVSTVVGLLVFRFVHSKKASVFTHSLPANRTSVYISTLAAAFTLMAVPVILNGLILMALSAVVYFDFISISSCFVWIAMNLLTLFLMFSCTSFVSMLTGNSFAMVGLNVLMHAIVPIITVAMNVVAGCFLYGFSDMSEKVSDIAESNFVMWIVNTVDNICRDKALEIEFGRMFAYLLIAVLFYVAGWVLYKKRHLENVEDVAGFKCLNPIFKYLASFVGGISVFALFSSAISENPVAFCVIVIMASAVIYFGIEMVLKKTFKVWKSYKGFIGFAAVFALVISVFAFTNFFGFETYVPEADEVASVTFYHYYYGEEPYVSDKNVIEYTTDVHKELLDDDSIYVLQPAINGREYYSRVHLKYKMKDGGIVERSYWVSKTKKHEIMCALYNFENYKLAVEKPLYMNSDDLVRITLYSDNNGSVTITDMKEMKSLYKCLRKDLQQLDYNQIYMDDYGDSMSIEYRYDDENLAGGQSIEYMDYQINSNFKNTINWFRQNGYGETVSRASDKPYYIKYNNSFIDTVEDIKKKSKLLTEAGLSMEGYDCIEDETIKNNIAEYFDQNYISYYPDKNYFYIINLLDTGEYRILGIIDPENVQEFEQYILR